MAEKLIEEKRFLRLEETDMETWVVRPAGEGPWPAVIMYMDAQSLRTELQRIAGNIARQGYVVVLFDLYHRFGYFRPHLRTRDATIKTAMRAMVVTALNHVSYPYVMKDTEAVIGYLDDQPFVAKSPMGTIGFCFSGRFALIAAAHFPERIKAAVSLFGTELVTEAEDSPHRQFTTIAARVYAAFAEQDRYIDRQTICTVSSSLKAAGIEHEVEVIPDCDHGFCFMDGGHVYSEQASEHAWQKTYQLFEQTLENSNR